MIKRFVTGLLLLFAVPVMTFAQYGKLSGKITDRDSKEPLVGATISLQGTSMGASSDINGQYVILNVPAGTYTLTASYVGYHPLNISGVTVIPGLTRALDIQLTSTAVQVTGVEIVAERPLIEKTATNAIRVQSATDIENLPVRGLQSYFTLQPGVVLQNGVVYMRGSRSDEVGYQVEGADTKNIISTTNTTANVGSYGTAPSNLVTTIPEALQDVTVEAGGFGAEYGGSNSGIVQQTFKTGGSKVNFSLQGETDNFGNYPGKQALGTYSYGYSDYVLTLGGPLMTDNIKFFLAGENNFVRDVNPWYWSGANLGYLYDDGSAGGTKGDSALVNWPSGNVPGRSNSRYSGNGTLLFDYKPVQVRIAAAYTWQRAVDNNLIMNMFDLVRTPVTDLDNILLNGRLSYFVSANTFFEVNLNYLNQRDKTYDPNFGDNILQYNDSLYAAQRGFVYPSRFNSPQDYIFNGFPFLRPGGIDPNNGLGYAKDNNGYLGGSVDLTSQVSNHELKVGGSYQYWAISRYSFGDVSGLAGTIYGDPNSARDPAALALLLRKNAVNNYGFDEFGNPITSGPDAPKHPYFAAAYVQDQMQFSDLIVNAGLRLDYLYLDSWQFPNLDSLTSSPVNGAPPMVDQKQALINPGLSKTYAYVEPRLGFSFPVTDQTVFHLQYGAFVQAPPLYSVYRSRAAAAQIFLGSNYFTNPIGYNVSPERTTQYEVGFSQQFSDVAALDATAFYKDVTGQLQVQYIAPVGGNIAPYLAYGNGDFETSEGLEFNLRFRRANRLQAEFNYTLQDARGTNSFANSSAAILTATGGLYAPVMVTPLSYDQTHRGSLSLDYRWGKGDGGVLEQFGINLLLSFNSGHPYTLTTGTPGQVATWEGNILRDDDARTRYPAEPVNNSVTPWFYEFDLKIDKTIDFGGVGLNIYIYAQNLLNTKNVINVWYRTGNAYDDGYLSDPTASGKTVSTYGQNFVQLYQVENIQNNQSQFFENGFVNFGTPRQIRVGARLEF